MDSSAHIDAQLERLRRDFNLSVYTASEIEFYIPGASDHPFIPAFWVDVSKSAADAGIRLHNTTDESGKDQFEVSVAMVPDPKVTAADTLKLKSIIAADCKLHGLHEPDFSAKPFAGQPGSGLHIHVHLVDSAGKNVYFKNDLEMSPALKYSIGGLLAWLADCMVVFAPSAGSYKRFSPMGNAPLTVSWGANNRTVAVRLPDAAHANKHIELRIAGADADPGKVIAVMLAAIHYGLKHQCEPGPQIYGDASLPMYNLARLPESLEEARRRLEQSEVIKGYFSASDLL